MIDQLEIRCGISRGRDVAEILRAALPVKCPMCLQMMNACPQCGALVHESDLRGVGCNLCVIVSSFL
jgi:hypothetical protein